MLETPTECWIYYRYTKLLKGIFENATASVKLYVDTIQYLSTKLFIIVLKFIITKRLWWDDLDFNMNGEILTHLRSTSDIILINRFNQVPSYKYLGHGEVKQIMKF